MYWDIARHPGDVTENGTAAFDDVVSHRGETGLYCDFSVTDAVTCRNYRVVFGRQTAVISWTPRCWNVVH